MVNPRVTLVAAGLSAATFAAAPANATTGAIHLAGSTVITPGLSLTTLSNTFTYAASGAIVSDSTQGSVSCEWSGKDVGTIARGSGTFSGGCATPHGTTSISASYSRTGGTLTVSGAMSGGGVSGGITGTCDWNTGVCDFTVT